MSDVIPRPPGARGNQAGEPRTAGEMLKLGREFLQRRGAAEWRLDAELLVAHALELDRLQLFLQLDRPVTAGEVARARELLMRRGKGEPVAYLTGQREFYGRAFQVGPGVLIPRPETEHLVDRARELARELAGDADAPPLTALDLGTGSGCIAVTLALELPARVIAVDVSPAALACARGNAERLGADVRFVLGDGLTALGPEAEGAFDLLVSNPPYVDPADTAALAEDVRRHEPPEALFAPAGEPDYWVLRILDEGLGLLRAGGRVLIELGLGQSARLLPICAERGLTASVHRDLAGIDRVLEIAV